MDRSPLLQIINHNNNYNKYAVFLWLRKDSIILIIYFSHHQTDMRTRKKQNLYRLDTRYVQPQANRTPPEKILPFTFDFFDALVLC